MDPTVQPPIIYQESTITEEQVRAFNAATLGRSMMPLTFFTRYRKAEFEWLDRVKVNMKELLHTEQAFEFLEPLKVGDQPKVSTRIVSLKSRRSMTFYELLTEIECSGVVKVRSHTYFLIRSTKDPHAAG